MNQIPKTKVLIVKLRGVDIFEDYGQTIYMSVNAEVREYTHQELTDLRFAISRWNQRHYSKVQYRILEIATDDDIDSILSDYRKAEAAREKASQQDEAKRKEAAEKRKRKQYEKLKKEYGD